MNEHRPPLTVTAQESNLDKAAKELAGEAGPQHSWVDDARKSAYSFVDEVKETAHLAPVGTAFAALAVAVAAYGAVRTGMAAKAVVTLAKNETLSAGGGVLATESGALARGEALALERGIVTKGAQALAVDSGDALTGAGRNIVHLTTADGQAGIAKSLKIGGRWGVFGLDSAQVPESGLLRNVKSLVTKDLVSEVPVGPRASSYFQSPTRVGPFSLARNLAGVKSTPLGTIDLARDAFVPNEIFANGGFRQAAGSEVAKYKVHQWLLDYGVDSLAYSLAGFTTAAYEYNQLAERSLHPASTRNAIRSQNLIK